MMDFLKLKRVQMAILAIVLAALAHFFGIDISGMLPSP